MANPSFHRDLSEEPKCLASPTWPSAFVQQLLPDRSLYQTTPGNSVRAKHYIVNRGEEEKAKGSKAPDRLTDADGRVGAGGQIVRHSAQRTPERAGPCISAAAAAATSSLRKCACVANIRARADGQYGRTDTTALGHSSYNSLAGSERTNERQLQFSSPMPPPPAVPPSCFPPSASPTRSASLHSIEH